MARFKLLAGTHDVGSGQDRKTFRWDEPDNNVVESDKPLDKMFKNKFERLNGKTEEPTDHDNTLNESGRQGDDPEHLKRRGQKTSARKPLAETLEESPKPQRVKPRDPGYEEEYDAEVEGKEDDEDEDAEAVDVVGDDVSDEFEVGESGFTVHKDAKAKAFRIAKDGKQVGRDLKNKTEAKKALKAAVDKAATEEEGEGEDAE